MWETDTFKSGLQTCYMVSYQVAETSNTHSIVEDLILPATMDMFRTMLGEKAMPSSNNTVSRRISDMAVDVK